MAVLDPIVETTTDLLAVGIAKLGHGRAVGAQPVGVDRLRGPVALQRFLHEAERRLLVALLGDVALKDLAFVIDRAPEIVLWWNRSGPLFAGEIRRQRVSRMRGFKYWKWHLDEMVVKVNGSSVRSHG